MRMAWHRFMWSRSKDRRSAKKYPSGFTRKTDNPRNVWISLSERSGRKPYSRKSGLIFRKRGRATRKAGGLGLSSERTGQTRQIDDPRKNFRLASKNTVTLAQTGQSEGNRIVNNLTVRIAGKFSETNEEQDLAGLEKNLGMISSRLAERRWETLWSGRSSRQWPARLTHVRRTQRQLGRVWRGWPWLEKSFSGLFPKNGTWRGKAGIVWAAESALIIFTL